MNTLPVLEVSKQSCLRLSREVQVLRMPPRSRKQGKISWKTKASTDTTIKLEPGFDLDMALYLSTCYTISRGSSEMYLVSSCLCGNHCRYNGSAGDLKRYHAIQRFLAQGLAVPVCPEVLEAWPFHANQPRFAAEQGQVCFKANQEW